MVKIERPDTPPTPPVQTAQFKEWQEIPSASQIQQQSSIIANKIKVFNMIFWDMGKKSGFPIFDTSDKIDKYFR